MTFSFKPRRDERVGRQRRLGNTQQQIAVGRRQLAIFEQGFVGVEDFRALDLLTCNVGGVTHVLNHDTAQHLAHDHFDVLVVDLHAL